MLIVVVVFVFGMGVFNVICGFGGLFVLFDGSMWGCVLLLKLLFVVFVLVFGGFNCFLVLLCLCCIVLIEDVYMFCNILYFEGMMMIGVFVVVVVLLFSVLGFVVFG